MFESKTKSIGQLQDMALFRVRTMFAGLAGISSPPPFGGNIRTIVVNVDPDRLRSYNLSPQDIVAAIDRGNFISPSGNVQIKDQLTVVPTNAMVVDPQELRNIPLKLGQNVYLRDVGTVSDATDLPVGYALVNGQKSVYLPVVKQASSSTLTVVNAIRANMTRFQAALPDDVKISYQFDESPIVYRAIESVGVEGALGAGLTGLMVLLFLRDLRAVIVVVLNIPLALLGSVVVLNLTGHTINIMTLGGLALAIGILVDEATVEIENIHTQMEHTPSMSRAVRQGNMETAVPRLLALLCILSVFIPAFIMEGPVRSLFVPLSLAVGASMVTSYLLSSTLVPVLSVWLLENRHGTHGNSSGENARPGFFLRFQNFFEKVVEWTVVHRIKVVVAYLIAGGAVVVAVGGQLGRELFPRVDAGQFQLRIRPAQGTHYEITRQIAQKTLEVIADEAGPENIDITMGYVGANPPQFTINMAYLWSRGPDDSMLRVGLRHGSKIGIFELQERLREVLPKKVGAWYRNELKRFDLTAEQIDRRVADLVFAFEPGDLISETMSLGSPAPIEVVVSGRNLADSSAFMDKLRKEFARIETLRDVQVQQSLHYPTVQVTIDRERAGLSGVTARDIGESLIAATYSSRYTARNYWRDEVSGNSYQVQVQVPPPSMTDATDVGLVPLTNQANRPTAMNEGSPSNPAPPLLVRDVATVMRSDMPGEVDRYNMRRYLSLTANVEGEDLGRVIDRIDAAIARAGAASQGHRGRASRPGPAHEADVPQPGDRTGRGRRRDPDHAHGLLPGPQAGDHRRGVGARRARRRGDRSGGHADHAEHRVVHGGDHGRGRGGVERNHARDLRRSPPPGRGHARASGGHHRGQGAVAADHDDGLRHDLGHDPHVSRPGRRQRAERPARPRGDRRDAVRHLRHAAGPAGRVHAPPGAIVEQIPLARPRRPGQLAL